MVLHCNTLMFYAIGVCAQILFSGSCKIDNRCIKIINYSYFMTMTKLNWTLRCHCIQIANCHFYHQIEITSFRKIIFSLSVVASIVHYLWSVVLLFSFQLKNSPCAEVLLVPLFSLFGRWWILVFKWQFCSQAELPKRGKNINQAESDRGDPYLWLKT